MHFYRRRRVSPVITIVSLVDILTMVLMFFVYTTTFKTATPQVQIVLPESKVGAEAPADTKPALLAINKAGEVYLDDKAIEVDALGAAIKKLQDEGRKVAMKADEEAPFGKIMRVLDALKTAGVQNIPALTRKPGQ